jgi:hypothetical protein
METELKLTLEELIIVAGLVVGHRAGVVDRVAEAHWEVLEALHTKIVKSLAVATDKELPHDRPGTGGVDGRPPNCLE